MKQALIVLLIIALSNVPKETSAVIRRDPVCLLPEPLRQCMSLAIGWRFDQEEETCVPFHGGGCYNPAENHFSSQEACRRKCQPLEVRICSRLWNPSRFYMNRRELLQKYGCLDD
ncbi:kunitz-type serine protease inhibitor vestiginin-2 [Fopius arisanus]|uniref:Kunitz-type serine protease inhibitor vestiginin-2 n=1 Tax=Fopius arisanus TaxID=64838 RepID=A0A0C9RK94_9HYME|nr:PREDICTED: kunitz-type serine protease inhibitor vestiginin-2 [Fopius arisanus]